MLTVKQIEAVRYGVSPVHLRTSFRTWARKQGCYAQDVIETSLSHEKDQLIQAYMRDDLLEEPASDGASPITRHSA